MINDTKKIIILVEDVTGKVLYRINYIATIIVYDVPEQFRGVGFALGSISNNATKKEA
jgi:hypothetical protein